MEADLAGYRDFKPRFQNVLVVISTKAVNNLWITPPEMQEDVPHEGISADCPRSERHLLFDFAWLISRHQNWNYWESLNHGFLRGSFDNSCQCSAVGSIHNRSCFVSYPQFHPLTRDRKKRRLSKELRERSYQGEQSRLLRSVSSTRHRRATNLGLERPARAREDACVARLYLQLTSDLLILLRADSKDGDHL